ITPGWPRPLATWTSIWAPAAATAVSGTCPVRACWRSGSTTGCPEKATRCCTPIWSSPTGCRVRTDAGRRWTAGTCIGIGGARTPRLVKWAVHATRKPKEHEAPDTLYGRWCQEAAERGHDPDTLVRQMTGRTPNRGQDRTVSAEAVGRLLDRLAGPTGLTEHASTLSRPEVLVALSGGLAGAERTELEELADRLLADRPGSGDAQDLRPRHRPACLAAGRLPAPRRGPDGDRHHEPARGGVRGRGHLRPPPWRP